MRRAVAATIPWWSIRDERNALRTLGAVLMDRTRLLRRGVWQTGTTVAWNAIEGIIAVGAGIAASSVALIGFGVDSFVETASATIVGWRLRSELSGRADHDQAEALAGPMRLRAWPVVPATRPFTSGKPPANANQSNPARLGPSGDPLVAPALACGPGKAACSCAIWPSLIFDCCRLPLPAQRQEFVRVRWDAALPGRRRDRNGEVGLRVGPSASPSRGSLDPGDPSGCLRQSRLMRNIRNIAAVAHGSTAMSLQGDVCHPKQATRSPQAAMGAEMRPRFGVLEAAGR
jgi:hypothetical protein